MGNEILMITTYLQNQDAYKKRNELLDQAYIRLLTDKEKTELDELITDIERFENEILLNFE